LTSVTVAQSSHTFQLFPIFWHLSENLFPPLFHPGKLISPTFTPNSPSLFGKGKSIYKPSHLEPDWLGLRFFPLHLHSHLYPPARNWRSTAVQKVVSHYYSFGGFPTFFLFILLLLWCPYCPSPPLNKGTLFFALVIVALAWVLVLYFALNPSPFKP
jgi:hypothetical protein